MDKLAIMKKVLVALVLMTMSFASFAQLNIQSKNEKVEIVGTLRSTYAYLGRQGGMYFLRIRTDNQFDNGCNFVLGKDVLSSVRTLNDLYELTQTLENNASVNATDADGTEVLIVRKTMLGQPYLIFKMEDCAGSSNITYKELERAKEMIMKEEGIDESDIKKE